VGCLKTFQISNLKFEKCGGNQKQLFQKRRVTAVWLPYTFREGRNVIAIPDFSELPVGVLTITIKEAQ
jgi:hypothetical protein